MARPHNGLPPIHPGEILREDYLKPMGMSANALSKALRVPAARINDIVLERRAVTPDTALRLVRFFGGDARTWLNLQASYDLKIAERKSGALIAKEVRPKLDVEHVAAAIETDAGQPLPGLRDSLDDMNARRVGAVHTPKAIARRANAGLKQAA